MPEIISQDEQYLKILTIFHYIVGALMLLFACVFIIHLMIGVVAITAPELFKSSNGTVPPPFFGWVFAILGGAAVIIGWSMGTCVIIAGRFLARRKHFLFCFVMAAVMCIFFPFGTALGIFTLLTLARPTVKKLFDVQPSAPGAHG